MKNRRICYFKGYLLLNLQIMVSMTEQPNWIYIYRDKNTKQNSSKLDLHKIYKVKLTATYIAIFFGKYINRFFENPVSLGQSVLHYYICYTFMCII